MDDLDGTNPHQLSVPVPTIDMEPLASDRAADGTKTRIGAAAMPPPRRPAASAPPPIPTAAFPLASPADMTPPNAADSVDVPIDVDDVDDDHEPSSTLHGQGAPVHVLKVVTPDAVPADSSAANSAELAASAVTAAADEAPRAPTASEAALPPLPTASREWMRASSQVIAPAPHAPRAMPPAPRPSLRGNTPPRGARTTLSQMPAGTPATAVPVAASAAGTQPNPMVTTQPMPVQPMPVQPMPVQPMPVQPIAQAVVSAHMPVATPRPSQPAMLAPNPFEDEVVPTTYFERTAAPRPWNGKMLAGIGLAAVAGVSILALALRGGGDGKQSNDSTATAQQEVTPHKRSHKRVASADVEAPTAGIDSKSDGAKHDSDDGVAAKHDSDDGVGTKHDTDVASGANHAADVDQDNAGAEAPTAHPDMSTEAPTAHDTTAHAGTTVPRGDHAMARVEIPISTWPAGALVTLVDNGTTTVLGKTPLIASLDPSHAYDIVLALKDRPTTVKHLDPRTTHNLAVDFDDKHHASTETARTEPARAQGTQTSSSKPARAGTTAAPRVTQTSVAQSAYGQSAVPAPAAPRTGTAVGTGTNPAANPGTAASPGTPTNPGTSNKATPGTSNKATTAPATPVAKAAPATQAPVVAPPPPKKNAKLEALTAAPEASAEVSGTLAITSTPACEIVVDGSPTRLSTPQRTLSLSPGSHVITLVNASENIRKSFAVKIEAKHTTNLAHDFTH